MTINNGRQGEKQEWELPHLRESHQLSNSADFWDVKFYPYLDLNEVPIFAVINSQKILICRAPVDKQMQILRSISDDEEENDNYACAWSKDLETKTPLICVGGTSGKIKVINALTGELLRVLIGHGGDINTLETSPVNPHILASGSTDCTVRIWTLDPIHKKEPCAAILAGDGHRETVLTVAFHPTGRYLLSGGIDHIINLWVLPSIPNSQTGTNKPTRIYYPHFSTSEIHDNMVDCVTFHNDLILSKSDKTDLGIENNITLWAISGFSSLNPPPPPASAPTAHDQNRDTRSAFTPPGTPPYTRLAQLSIPDSSIMFTRFGVFHGMNEGNRGPVVAWCNEASKVFFWDLARFEAYWDYLSSLPADNTENPTSIPILNPTSTSNPIPTQNPISGGTNDPAGIPNTSTSFSSTTSSLPEAPKRPPFLIHFKPRLRGGAGRLGVHTSNHSHSHRMRDGSASESERSTPSNLAPSKSNNSSPNKQASTSTAAANPQKTQTQTAQQQSQNLQRSLEAWSSRYGIDDMQRELKAHREDGIKNFSFVGRQVAWSPSGEWCIVVGSLGVCAVFERWRGTSS